jgi:hypothetical protein
MHLDPAESDPRTLTEDEMRTLRNDARPAASSDEVRADQPGGERPIEVWHWLLAAALGLLAVEGWLRQRRASGGGFA